MLPAVLLLRSLHDVGFTAPIRHLLSSGVSKATALEERIRRQSPVLRMPAQAQLQGYHSTVRYNHQPPFARARSAHHFTNHRKTDQRLDSDSNEVVSSAAGSRRIVARCHSVSEEV